RPDPSRPRPHPQRGRPSGSPDPPRGRAAQVDGKPWRFLIRLLTSGPHRAIPAVPHMLRRGRFRLMLLRPLSLLIALMCVPFVGAGCGIPDEDRPDTEVDAGSDGGDLPDDGGDSPGEGEDEEDDPHAEADIDWDFGAPISVPLETWTYVPIEGARCANGTDTGVAVNFTDRSDDLVVFMAPGGACWDSLTCFILRSASHLEDTMQGQVVVDEAIALGPL